MFFTARMSWSNLHSWSLDFLTSKMGRLEGLKQGIMRPGALKSIMSILPWRDSFLIRYWLNMGRGFKGFIWILMELLFEFNQYLLEILHIRKMVADFAHKEDGTSVISWALPLPPNFIIFYPSLYPSIWDLDILELEKLMPKMRYVSNIRYIR